MQFFYLKNFVRANFIADIIKKSFKTLNIGQFLHCYKDKIILKLGHY